MTKEELAALFPFAEISATGSRAICSPPPVNSDADFLVFLKSHDDMTDFVSVASQAGFEWESNEHYQEVADDGFMSWRRGMVNLIVTKNREFAASHRLATSVCKRLNVMSKEDRVAVFRAFLYAEEAP